MKFNINLPYDVEYTGAYKETGSLIFCDYTRSVKIVQNDEVFYARIGYVGRDKLKTRAKYLFIQDRIHYLEDPDITTPDYFNPDKLGFPTWLSY